MKLKEDLRQHEDVEMENNHPMCPINLHENLSTSSTTTTNATATAATRSTCAVTGVDDGRVKVSNWRSQYPSRKTRRRWCRELHRRFVDALNQLGGPHGQMLIN